jgi:hypothetical protein
MTPVTFNIEEPLAEFVCKNCCLTEVSLEGVGVTGPTLLWGLFKTDTV